MVVTDDVKAVTLAHKAVREHDAVRKAASKALDHAVRAGQYLLEAKVKVKAEGGKWQAWCDEHVTGIAPSTRGLYMSIAEHWDELQHVADVEELTIVAARSLLQKRRKDERVAEQPSADQAKHAEADVTAPAGTVGGSVGGEPKTEAELDQVLSIGHVEEKIDPLHALAEKVEKIVGVETFTQVEQAVRAISANPGIVRPEQRPDYVRHLISLQQAIAEALAKLGTP